MSNLKKELQENLKKAMKKKDNFTRDCIRAVTSAIKQVEVDTQKELSDDDIIKIIQKMVKQREDAIKQFKQGNRDDLVQKEQSEIDFLKKYLPKQLDDTQLLQEIKKIILKIDANSIKDLGKVMAEATKNLGTKADGKRISNIAKQLLSE